MNLNDLFEQYRNNPSEFSLTEVLKSSQNLIYGIVVKVANHAHDSEDLAQEVLIKVIQNINILPKDVNFGGWLNRTSMNVAINYFHQKQRLKLLKPNIQELKKIQTKECDEEIISIIYQHLSQLESLDESLILDKYIHQMTYAQMCGLYKLPKSTIESKINNILGKLKNSIEKAGFAGVAIAIVSTLDQLKANELSINLIPQLKNHIPTNYPKPKTNIFLPKVLLKVAIPMVAVLMTFFTMNNLVSSNGQNNYPPAEVIKNVKVTETNEALKPISDNTSLPTKDNDINESTADADIPMEGINPTQSKIEEKPIAIENDFAGQLIDAESKKPIANAKLEIWDIYTHKKIESITDSEGKYFIPQELETTFFFYLKFTKDDYAVKQTFQHFEIHKRISISMSKGKRINQILTFDKPANTLLYRSAPVEIEKEQHLTMNQKQLLKQITSAIKAKAPVEFFALQVIKIENVKEYDLSVLVGKDENCGYLSCDDFRSGVSIDDFFPEKFIEKSANSGKKLRFATTGKMALDVEFSAVNVDGTAKNFNLSTDKMGQFPSTTNGAQYKNLLNLGRVDYMIEYIPYFSDLYSDNPDKFKGINTTYLLPSTSILFEPLSLSREFHNIQILFGDTLFSKKSNLKKSDIYKGILTVTDQFFEKIILTSFINIPIGGVIDINSKLNSSNDKSFKLELAINNKPVAESTIDVFLKEENQLDFSLPLKVRLNENGSGNIKVSAQTKTILVSFYIKECSYSKLIDLNQISGDNISLNFNRLLTIKRSQESIDSNLKAKAINKNAQKRNGMFKIGSVYDQKKIVNNNTFIQFQNDTQKVYIEDGAEYFLIDYAFGIKTNYNQLKATNHLIKSNSDKIEVKPVSEVDYSTFHVDIVDEQGAEVENVHWFIKEYEGNTNFVNSKLGFPVTPYQLLTSDEFCNSIEGNKISAEFLKEKTVGEQAILKKTVSLLNNRHYFVKVMADGYMTYLEFFSTKDNRQINKKVVMRKSNAVKFNANHEFEFYEISKLLKDEDIIIEYNGAPVTSIEKFQKSLQECNQEKVTIKLIRNQMPMSLVIPAFNIAGLEDCHYEDKKK